MNFLTAQTFHKIMAAVRSTEEKVYLLSQSINYNNTTIILLMIRATMLNFPGFVFSHFFLLKIKL